MNRSWWNLPGPDEFVQGVALSLREGSNVVLCLPEQLPEGIGEAIQDVFRDSYESPWFVLSLRDCEEADPLLTLYTTFESTGYSDRLCSIPNLIGLQGFAGKIFWVDGIDSKNWPSWRRFLTEYEQWCRGISLFERSVFCVPLTGAVGLAPPQSDVALTIFKWQGVVQPLDTLIYTSSCFRSVNLPPIRRQLAIAITSAVALWDPIFSLRLANETEMEIYNPVTVAGELAAIRGWEECEGADVCEQWCLGALNEYKSRPQYHTAWLITTGDRREIDKRIWSAQAAVLLPYVEERRQALLRELSAVLKVPFCTRYGEIIDDIYDLEIGHIEAQLSTCNQSVATDVRKRVGLLRRIRNSLSHLEPLTLDLILSQELNHVSPNQNSQGGLS
jgi:hypothetical protein